MKPQVKLQAVTQKQLLQLETHQFVMASAIKIIYLLQTINILYKKSFNTLNVSTLKYNTQENVSL